MRPQVAAAGGDPLEARAGGRSGPGLPIGAVTVLPLRAVISNGDFEEYWRFHLQREHQRLYPGIKQEGQYALGA